MSKERDERVNEAFAVYLRHCDAGTLSSREDFLSQFPDIRDQLSELIESADMIGQATQNALGGIGLEGTGLEHEEDVSLNSFALTGFSTPTVSGDLVTINSDDLPSGAKTGFYKSQTADEPGGLREDAPDAIHQHPGAADPSLLDPSAETIQYRGDGSAFIPRDGHDDEDPAATLPVANRRKGDKGPTLPYDLGDYLLLEVIGRGGMGVVYKANQSELERHVAIKMIRSGMLASEAEVRRFNTEAQAAAKLHHPGIVSVFQSGKRAGHHFFSMEYIDGTDLQKKINQETLGIRDAARYVRDVARAIEHAHDKGVLHRDIKPANVLIDRNDQIHVTDFGLAKHLDRDSSVTASGDAVGTPHYMAPEQAVGQSDRASRQSDVYSLGAVLFAAVAGRPPLLGDTVMQTMVKVVHDPAPLLRSIRGNVPVDLQTIVAKCLEKNPKKRYQTAGHLADELNAFLEGRPIDARPRSAVMRTWHWIEGVPLVGALMGRRILHGSASHRRFQAGLLMLFLLMPIVTVTVITYIRQHQNDMPAIVRMGGGLSGGVYHDVSLELSSRIREHHLVDFFVMESVGSDDNHDKLLRHEVDLAPMQATSIRGDHLRVVAPMFYEPLYVLAKETSSLTSLEELPGHRVAVGPPGSGSNAMAALIFDWIDLDRSAIKETTASWDELLTDESADVAMICMGRGSDLVSQLLQSGQWRLIPLPANIDIALQHPTLLPMTITEFSDRPVPTVGTTAFLAARDDAPSDLVVALLNALYEDPPPCDDLIPRRQAAEWQGLAFHAAARQFYGQTP